MNSIELEAIATEAASMAKRIEVLRHLSCESFLYTSCEAIFRRESKKLPRVSYEDPFETLHKRTWDSTAGIEIAPRFVESVADLAGVLPVYDRSGKPVQTSTGEWMCIDAGRRYLHTLSIGGEDRARARQLLDQLALWAMRHSHLFLDLAGYEGQVHINTSLGLWIDVVYGISGAGGPNSIVTPEWYVVIESNQKMSISCWKERRAFEFEVGEEVENRIGDPPQDYFRSTKTFLDDS